MNRYRALLDRALAGDALADAEAMALVDCDDLAALMAAAAMLRDRGHGANVSYSRKVFIPLTKLCRDSCHYCTFAHPPRRNAAAYLTPDEVLAIARAGAAVDFIEDFGERGTLSADTHQVGAHGHVDGRTGRGRRPLRHDGWRGDCVDYLQGR